MSVIGCQPLPEALGFFLVATAKLHASEDVNKTRRLLWDIYTTTLEQGALRKRKPRDILNRRIGQARRRDPEQFMELALWADSNDVWAACFWRGDYWCCLRAFTRIYLGDPAHVAFGMVEGGHPAAQGFTKLDDAAFRTELHIRKGIPREEALTRGCDEAEIGLARRREVQRQLASVRAPDGCGLIFIGEEDDDAIKGAETDKPGG